MKSFTKVFISHAKEDNQEAIYIYNFLKKNGFNPWLDEKELLPGMQWDYEIKKALSHSDFIIILLSSVSVAKRGYIQREFNLALTHAEIMLDDDIYIIPLKLDECNIPTKLQKYQWINIENENAYDIVLKALHTQRQKRLEELSIEERKIDDYSIQSIDLKIPNVSNDNYICEIPIFYENNYFDAECLNTIIKARCYDFVSTHREEIEEDIKNLESFYIQIDYEINYISKNIISITLTNDSMIGQKIHPNTYCYSLNIKLSNMYILRIDDVIGDIDNLTLKNYIEKYGDEEQQFLLNVLELDNEGDFYQYIDDNIEFYLTSSYFCFDFTNIVPRAFIGISHLKIPFSELKLKIDL